MQYSFLVLFSSPNNWMGIESLKDFVCMGIIISFLESSVQNYHIFSDLNI